MSILIPEHSHETYGTTPAIRLHFSLTEYKYDINLLGVRTKKRPIRLSALHSRAIACTPGPISTLKSFIPSGRISATCKMVGITYSYWDTLSAPSPVLRMLSAGRTIRPGRKTRGCPAEAQMIAGDHKADETREDGMQLKINVGHMVVYGLSGYLIPDHISNKDHNKF